MERPQSDPAGPLRARWGCRPCALGLLAGLGWGIIPALGGAQPACPPAPATVAVFAENLSADPGVAITVAGELLDPSATCGGGGATSYASAFTCTGSGLTLCGNISGLRPGAWVNHVTVTVAGSDSQAQHQRAVFAASDPNEAAKNSLGWRVYPRTFVVTEAAEANLRAQLDAAAAYTAANLGPALVTFSRTVFPGAQAPQTIDLSRGLCAPDPSRAAALCFTGSRIIVDALDARGERGGVIWSVGTRALSLLRLYGRESVFRGLVFAGSQFPTPVDQADTIVITGAAAQANRIEQALVYGPTRGDAMSADSGAGDPPDGSGTNVIDGSELTRAEDKGLKVSTGAHLTLRRSCVHDNAHGGVQATLGGHAVAVENVVQHNVPQGTGHGLGATGDPAAPSTLVTDGNVVRFAAGRGLSVVNAAEGTFANDYVADNQYTGSRVETTDAGSATAVPRARFHGVAFICNRNAGVSGSCQPQTGNEATTCETDRDCCGLPESCCIADPSCDTPLRCAAGAFPQGFGAVQTRAAGHEPPDVWYGGAVEPGRNAFAWNRNVAPGVNFDVDVAGATVSAEGNQWEHCGAGALCDTAAVAVEDIRLAAGASVALGTPPGARTGVPVLNRVAPSRPRQGDLVRVFGDDFNAIEGTACAQETAPADPCSVENPWVEQQNQQTQVNRIRILALDGTILATLYPDAVTPTMLAFRMPFDCFTPLRLLVTEKDPSGNRVSAKIPLCDAAGCEGQPAGLPCDDGDVCTVADQCADGVCRGEPVCGDCVPDGTIDIFDVLHEIDIILGRVMPTPTEALRCDADCDGDIDIFDVLREIDAILGPIPRPLACPDQQAPHTTSAAAAARAAGASAIGRTLGLAPKRNATGATRRTTRW